ncbi:MAG: hypothetical protein GKS00_17840 [Alphaproteobacteria bacterium]|nr:hypothetical protein [Alphaproteobacteria bacterium]
MAHPDIMDILSVFGIRGRSKEVYRLDDALRAVGLAPKRVPDSVKLTVLNLLKDAEGGVLADVDASCARAAPMLAYCVLGSEEFGEANGPDATSAIEARLHHAIASGESLDARFAMLTLLAKVTQPEVIERFDLRLD